MKVLADVNVSRHVVERLRGRGFDIARVSEVMDPRSPDELVIDKARLEQAVVVSHDQDMSAILAVSGMSSPSLINLRVSRVDVEFLASIIESVLITLATELASGAIVTVEEGSFRIHALPIDNS